MMTSAGSRIVAVEHVTLDGVYQAPGREEEDTSNGFSHGGWSKERDDPAMQTAIARYMEGGWSLLAGRKTFEVLRESWPLLQPESPMTKALTGVRKFVLSRSDEPLSPWANTELLTGDGVDAVSRIKDEHGKTLIVFGSGELLRSLLAAGLVDEWFLMVHPVVVGEGLRLFDRGVVPSSFRLIGADATDAGVLLVRYGQGSAG